jgi:Ni,Fe-hydrogenase III component G
MTDIENKIKEKLTEKFDAHIQEATIPRTQRMFVRVDGDALHDILKFLHDTFNFTHISTISGVDLGETIEIVYHLHGGGTFLGLKTRVSKSDPTIKTVTPIIPGAKWYEREIQDMLGVKVEGHPDPRRLILPENWPDNVFPLRKDWKVESVIPKEIWWSPEEPSKETKTEKVEKKENIIQNEAVAVKEKSEESQKSLPAPPATRKASRKTGQKANKEV